MSATTTNQFFYTVNDKVRNTLLQEGRMPPDGPELIQDTMLQLGMTLEEAAVHLGFVTEEELVSILESSESESTESEQDGIFEGAIQKINAVPGLPVKYMGMVKAGPNLLMVHDPQNPFCERVRAMRTELMLRNGPAHAHRGHSIALVSPCAGEGRSQLSAELAVAFAQLGLRTLLVDGDLRRSRIHSLFDGENNEYGLGQSLTIRGVPHLLGVHALPQLSVVTAGPAVHNPLELLSNGQFERQLADWRKKFEMVIVDTPPIDDFADGLAIASSAEQVVVVSRAGATPYKHMKEMLRRLDATQARIVGAVISNF